MYLLDTNTWLESLLQRSRHDETDEFLRTTPPSRLALSDFSLCTIGVATARKTPEVFRLFLQDLTTTGVEVIHLSIPELLEVLACRLRYELDFDDAYQYVAAEKEGLTIISFDPDFDRTPRGRKTPGQVLGERRGTHHQ